MCLKEDVLCLLSPDTRTSGNDLLIRAMQHSRHSVTPSSIQIVLAELVESGHALEFTEEGRRDGLWARERIACTPPLYRQYRRTRTGSDLRRQYLCRKRSEELKRRRRASM